jgi:hypothetical protein
MRTASALLFLCALSAQAADFKPDPRSVQRYEKAYRYPQAGWIVLHIEGDPYERGVQHGRLMAPEIAAHVKCFASEQSPKAPTEGWKLTRTMVNALFLRRFDREFLEEMKGIADGAAAAGAKFDGRAIDLIDIVALNSWEEVATLEGALEALPNGLEGIRFSKDGPRVAVPAKASRCSAFAATGPATKDGKIVFGHITMSDLYSANFYNVWLDIKPAKGRRVVIQSFPGGIQSGLDYYMNDAGILINETTIGQTRFDVKGMALASRIRKAAQYAESIDQVVSFLKENNNGLYTNEWLLADLKTDEIAMFELGTHKSKLWRSGKNEWFGGTEGFYWGCNNTKDLDVRLETVASVEGRPASVVFKPSDRDKVWQKLYEQHKGKIDLEFGRLAFTTAPLAAYHSGDAKVTDSALAKNLRSWALYGPPLGRTWLPTKEETEKYPDIRPLVSNPWTILHVRPPEASTAAAAVDLTAHHKTAEDHEAASDDDDDPPPKITEPAWHGTLLPKTDADIWLATAFAKYERIVALEKSLLKHSTDHKLSDADQEKVAVALFAHRADYELGSRAFEDVPLNKIKSDIKRDEWYRIASGKGVLLLHSLRQHLGAENFDAMMEEFGKANAGKPVTAAMFREFAEKADHGEKPFPFNFWLDFAGLPEYVRNHTGPFAVTTFYAELDQALIIYGTLDESPTNREAAESLQQAIRARGANVTVPIKSDTEVTADDLKKHHLLLIGRPDSNRVVEKVRGALPITFGQRSFTVRNDCYAHAASAVIAAAANPANPRYSVVVVAGLGADSTWRAAPKLPSLAAAEVVVLPNGGGTKALARKGGMH